MTIDEILAGLPRPSGRDDLQTAQEAHARIVDVLTTLRHAIYARTPDTVIFIEARNQASDP